MTDQPDLRSACQVFVASAFTVLTGEHVLPTPRYHAHMAVGRDYFGGSIMALAEFTALEALLDQRYAEPLNRKHAEFAKTDIFGLLEACIVRCAQAGAFTSSGPAVEESIDELHRFTPSATPWTCKTAGQRLVGVVLVPAFSSTFRLFPHGVPPPGFFGVGLRAVIGVCLGVCWSRWLRGISAAGFRVLLRRPRCTVRLS